MFLFSSVQNVTFAEDSTTGDGRNTSQTTGDGRNTSQTTGDDRNTVQPAVLSNPLDSSISSIPAFFGVLVDIILVFAIPFIVFFIIYAGFLYVTAQGNPEKIQKAHAALLYALIGGMLILGANVLLDVITNTVTQIK
jgi:hypothetical protein